MKPVLSILLLVALLSCNKQVPADILHYEDFRPYITQFNEDDHGLYIQHIPNDSVHSFLEKNIPLLDIPDKELEKIYYFRWWTT
jgi:light-regulated signal transduction histidine kinase (bacteriophytochrome)